MPSALDRGKKSPPAAGTVAFGFRPFGFADPGLHDAWVGVAAVECLLTARTGACGFGLVRESLGLSRDGRIEHLFSKNLADLPEQLFDVGQGGPPRRSVGSVELIDKIFGDGLKERPNRFDLRCSRLGACHPWFLSELASKSGIEFP